MTRVDPRSMLDESKDEIFEEDVIIKPLLKFKEFERFYCEQRYPKKKDTPIIWKINDTSDVFACFDFGDKPFIRLKQYLCSPETFDFIYPSMWHGKEE